MSIRIMSRIWDAGPPDPMQRIVLLAIADHADDQGRAYPSMVGIASKCGMTERGARGIILLGSPEYYSRFGFEHDPELQYPGPPAEYFQRLVISGDRPSGIVQYAKAFR